MIQRFTVAALLLACVIPAASRASAADDFLSLVPDAAAGFVVINQPAALDAKLQTLARQVQLPPMSPLTMLKMQFGLQEGVDENGTVLLLVLPAETEGALPVPVMLVPVTNYGKFLEPLEPEKPNDGISGIKVHNTAFSARSIGGYAAVCLPSNREVLKTLKPSASVPPALATWRPWLASKDLAGVVLPPGVKRLSAAAQTRIETLKTMMAQGPEQSKKVAEVFGVYGAIFQAAAKEVTAVGFGLQIDKQSTIVLAKRAMLVPGGNWAKIAASLRPAKQNLLQSLPARPFVAAGGTVASDQLLEAAMKFSTGMMKNMRGLYGLSEEQANQLAAMSTKTMNGVRAFSMVFGVGEGNNPIFSGVATVMRVDDSQAFLAGYEKWMRQYADALKGANSALLPVPEIEKTEVAGAMALQITMSVPKLPETQQSEQNKQMLEAMTGPGGKFTAWVAPGGPRAVVMSYDKALLQQTLEAAKQGKPGLADDAEIAKTAAMLPSDAIVVGYLSPRGMLDVFKRLAPVISPAVAGVAAQLPEFPATPPIGVAVTAAADEVNSCLVIPPELIQAIGTYAGEVRSNPGSPGGAPRTK